MHMQKKMSEELDHKGKHLIEKEKGEIEWWKIILTYFVKQIMCNDKYLRIQTM